MLTTKYIPVDRIIENVYMNHGFQNDFEWTDALEWIGKALKLMSAPEIYIQKVECITIENYRGELPSDLLQIDMFKEKSNSLPMRYTGDPFFINLHCSECPNLSSSCDITYKLNNNYIYTSFDEGEVLLSYTAFPVDDRGFPLVPDDEAFVEALEWYVAYRIAYKLWLNDRLSDKKLQFINKEKDWYMGKAITRTKRLTKDQLESWKNMTLRLIPKINEHATQFKSRGEQQNRINHNTNNFNQGDNT
jgi:hypothetical protein